MKNLITCLLIFLAGFSIGQEKTISSSEFLAAFEPVSKGYMAENYQLSFEQIIYLNPGDAKPYYDAKGKFFRGKGEEYRMEFPGQITIQNKDIKMVIDSANLVVLLFKPDTVFSPVDISKIQLDGIWNEATFKVSSNASVKKYKVDFNLESYQYKSAEYWVDTKTNRIQKMIFLMNPGNYFSDVQNDESQESPSIVMTYGASAVKMTGREFQVGDFLVEKNGSYSLVPEIKGFVLDDLRTKTLK